MPAWLATALPKLLVWLLTLFFKKTANDEQARLDLIQFNEIMYRKGLTSVKMRLDALGQIERVKDLWEKESNE